MVECWYDRANYWKSIAVVGMLPCLSPANTETQCKGKPIYSNFLSLRSKLDGRVQNYLQNQAMNCLLGRAKHVNVQCPWVSHESHVAFSHTPAQFHAIWRLRQTVLYQEKYLQVYIRYICARDRKGTLHGKRSVYCSKKNAIYLEKWMKQHKKEYNLLRKVKDTT